MIVILSWFIEYMKCHSESICFLSRYLYIINQMYNIYILLLLIIIIITITIIIIINNNNIYHNSNVYDGFGRALQQRFKRGSFIPQQEIGLR